MDRVNHMDVKFIWVNSNYQYVSSDSAGSSGGILYIWEATIFNKDYATVSDNFIAIYGTWIFNNSKVLIVVVYAPQYLSHKRVLLDYISSLIAHWNVETILMGDFNEVRSIYERFGSIFNHSISRLFNHFITSSGLVDVKLKGYSFMWAHPSATKMSKLDRFLVSEDKNLDIGNVSDETFLKRMELTWQLHDINQMEARDYVQKSKIKWAIEGDENSKFFYAFVANRQILNGTFILNELLAWCKRKMKPAVIFKVDFAKAYDSVRWDYLLDVLQA
nr:RNA-directed DNA polymerase, eukaryota [Tanacetum cinerariifolium]